MTRVASVESELRRTLEHYWSQLPVPSGPTIASVDIALPLGRGYVRVGVDAVSHRHILVPMPIEAPDVSDHVSSGVCLTTRALVSDEASVRYADLECARPDLTGVFTGLAADVCLALLAGPDDPGAAVSQQLDDWRALLGAGHAAWTTERFGGLVAELLILDELLDLDSRAVSWWTGPLGEAQDFRSPIHALEVKASLTKEGRLVRIHGTDQLETPVGGTLGLVWFRLRPADAGVGVGLVELIERCLAKGGAAGVLDRLDRAGLPAMSEPEVVGARFEIVERRWYRVDDGFPSIRPSRFIEQAVPAGVGAVEYLIDLDVVPADERPLAELLGAFLERR
ncbi:MAG: PD-(D/E)XK motif protein [Cellulomonadaceae bacterium]|nr:PD-(D/E)XK motif protein [Cellulomonadaceae bacterium]